MKITSENWCENHRHEASSIDREVEDGKESLQQIALQIRNNIPFKL
jgi:hypothetical protein